MKSFPNVICLALSTILVAGKLPAFAEAEIDVGHSAAGQLKVELGFAQPLALEASVFPGIAGYATGEMGVHSTAVDDPGNDFFQLSTAADFRFILLAKDPGMEVWNDHGSGYMSTNEAFFIGTAPFDTHPIWNIVNGTPGQAYSLTLKFRDLNGIYADSAPVVLSFAPVPPRLELTQTGPLQAMLSWPTNAADWELQSATNLTAANWITVTNAPVIVGVNFSLSITTAETQQFFRLSTQ